MIAIGVLAAFKGARALWLWPLSFVGMMLVGGTFGFAHVQLPYVEIGISASVLILGTMVALSIVPPLWTGAALIAGFAILHGYAHGNELPHSANGLAFALGFSSATVFLHLVGIGLAAGWKAIARSPANVPRRIVREVLSYSGDRLTAAPANGNLPAKVLEGASR
jgi:urease accessory protein